MGRIAHVATDLGYVCEEIHEGSYPLRDITRRFTMLNPLGYIIQMSWWARKRLRKADVVVSHGIYGPFLGGRRRIHVFHGTHSGTADAIRPHIPNLDYLVARYLWGGVYERLSCRAHINVAVSRFVAGEARRYYGSETRLIPNTINPVFLRDECPSRLECRRLLQLPEDRTLFLVVGRRERLKGWFLCKSLLDRLPGNSLLVSLGQGPTPEHPRLICRPPIAPEELRSYYRAADWTVSPSLYEGFGLTLLESWACGTPVVATPTGVALDLRGQSRAFDRYVADRCDDAESLEKALNRALFHPEMGPEQVGWGQELLQRDFSEDSFHRSWAQLLSDLGKT